MLEIPTNYILSLKDSILEENHIQMIDLPILRGNSLIGSSSQNDIKKRSFHKIIREEVHSPFLILGNCYHG